MMMWRNRSYVLYPSPLFCPPHFYFWRRSQSSETRGVSNSKIFAHSFASHSVSFSSPSHSRIVLTILSPWHHHGQRISSHFNPIFFLHYPHFIQYKYSRSEEMSFTIISPSFQHTVSESVSQSSCPFMILRPHPTEWLLRNLQQSVVVSSGKK
jgi:hypothetical protein